jgi:hypothetical protein
MNSLCNPGKAMFVAIYGSDCIATGLQLVAIGCNSDESRRERSEMRHNLGILLRHNLVKGASGKDLLCLPISDLIARAEAPG